MITRQTMISSTALRAFDTGMATTPEAVQAAKRGYNNTEAMRDVMLRRDADSAWMLSYWDMTDTLIDGIEAMRNMGEVYLPRFVDETEPEYTFRKKLTMMTNIYRDIVEGLASKPFDQEVTLVESETEKAPEELIEFTEDVDGSGSNLTQFAGATFFNGINSAVDWIWVDAPKDDGKVRSKAQAKADGIRPLWSRILGRNVLAAKSKIIKGKEQLTYIRIFEPGNPDAIRIFERNIETGVVSWELRVKGEIWIDVDGGKTQFAEVDSGQVLIGVIPITPFYTGRRDGRTFKFFPTLRDAADLQIELYQQESGLKYASTLTAYPMLAANGISPPMEADGKTPKRLAVGPSRVLYSSPRRDGGPAGEWAFVEPSATSLQFLQGRIEKTQLAMRELGRQPLTAQSPNLTVITTAAAANKAKSAVAQWAFMLKNALENAMVFTCLYKGINYDPSVYVYTDFDEFIDGKDLESLDADRERGDISQETLWEEKKRRGIYGPEFTADRERERLLKEVPADGAEDTGDEE
jgi:hypothetical protein